MERSTSAQRLWSVERGRWSGATVHRMVVGSDSGEEIVVMEPIA